MTSYRREKPRGERRRRNCRSDDDEKEKDQHHRYYESPKGWKDRDRDRSYEIGSNEEASDHPNHNQSSTNQHNNNGRRRRRRSRNSRSRSPQRSPHNHNHNHHHNQDRRKRRRKSSKQRSRGRYDGSHSPSRRSNSYDDDNKRRHHDKEEIRRYDDNDRRNNNNNNNNDDRTRQQRQRRRRPNNHNKRRNDTHYRNNSPRRRRRRRRRSPNSTQQQNVAVDVNVGADVIPVSSDDDDYEHHSADHNNHRKVNTSNNNNNNNSNNNNGSKNSSPPADQDDTIGHFKGREECVIADRYRLLKDVGMGTFGRVVQCLDLSRERQRRVDHNNYRQQQQQHRHDNDDDHLNNNNNNNNNIVAIKIVRNVKRYYESAIIEADIIKDVNRRGRRGRTHCSILYDTFSFHGHYCMVLESLGPSLYDFLKGQKYHPFPIYCVRDFAEQLLETLEYLHSFRLIHTDLKPENILLLNGREIPQRGGYSIPESTRIKVIDFGGATYDNEKKSTIVNTRQYRAPEVILNVGWGCPSDLWSVGCILAELYQGELLFATHDNIEHLALIEQMIGPFPRRMLKRAKNVELVDEAFDSNGAHRMELPTEKLAYVKRTAPLESIVYDEDEWFLRLLRRILVIDPDERLQAHQLLRFLEKYAHPKLRQGGGDVNRW